MSDIDTITIFFEAIKWGTILGGLAALVYAMIKR